MLKFMPQNFDVNMYWVAKFGSSVSYLAAKVSAEISLKMWVSNFEKKLSPGAEAIQDWVCTINI